MCERIKIPAIKSVPHNKTSCYYLPRDLQRLGSAFKSIIDHFAKMCENENQKIVELPKCDYYVKTHSVAADIAHRLGSIYANSLEGDDAEAIYYLMASDCVKAILYLNKIYNDLRMLKERTSEKYEEYYKSVYGEWLKYKSYLTPEKRIHLNNERF